MRTAETDLARSLDEPLTRREAEALALLAAGYSRPEIAAHLTLAISSVKFHIEHLYAKLGVNSKRQALSRARALGLLAPAPPAVPAARPQWLAASGRSADFGPAPQHNLPLQVTRFFGREGEIAQLRERLDENRLVTLTGPGGVGKTRLALRIAEELLPGFTDGVWLVELAPLSNPALVAQQIASSLGLRDGPGQPLLETLTFYLRERQVLLVLDNCEHLLAACGRLADSLLRACPRVRLLASSREPLGIAGEAVYSVPALSFPDPDHLPPIDHMTDYIAVNLFLDRVRLVLPDYQVTTHNAAALARICQRLDGIPLAIEMAASRLRLLNTETLAARLDDAFHVLTGGSRSALPRQQTLRATIDWSYNLLSEPERRLFQRLSVFAGGFTLEAAEAVCSGEGLEASQAILPGEIVEWLAALVEKSLVVAEREVDQETRYRLLEVMRQYAREQLKHADDSERWRTRHRDYFYSYLEAAVPKPGSAERPAWIQRTKADHDNLRQALDWSFGDASDVEAGPRLVLALPDWWSGFWASHQEYLDWHTKAVAWCECHAGVSPALYARVLGNASHPLELNDPRAALRWAERAVAISRGLGPAGKQTLLSTLGDLAWSYLKGLNEPERAQPLYAEAEAIWQGMADQLSPEQYAGGLASIANDKARLAIGQHQYLAAKMHASECIRLIRAGGDRWACIPPYFTLGIACLKLGEYDHARDHFLEALGLIEEIGDWHKSDVLRWLATVDWHQGHLGRALQYCRESLREAEKISDRNIIASDLGVCAGIAAKQGQAARAAQLSGAAAALYATQKRKAWEDSSLDTLLPGWRARPDAAAITAAFAAGQALNVEQAMAYALHDRKS